MAGSSRTIRANTRKKVDENKQDWERYRTKNKDRIAKEKDRERVAISKITTKFKNYKFRQQKIVDTVEVGEKPYVRQISRFQKII